jgi:hypothetical protein
MLSLVSTAQLSLNSGYAADPLTIEKLGDALNLKYEHMNSKRNKSSRNNNNDETALFAGGFQGKCNNCRKYGHKLTSQEIAERRTTRITRSTATEKTVTRIAIKMGSKCFPTSAICAREKATWQKTASRRSATKNRKAKVQTQRKTKMVRSFCHVEFEF